MTHNVKGLVLAGNRREYGNYLFHTKQKEREYPQITTFRQLQGYHETPPVICIGTYWKNEKYSQIRERALAAGIDVQDESDI